MVCVSLNKNTTRNFGETRRQRCLHIGGLLFYTISMSVERKQDLTDEFCQAPEHIYNLVYVHNLDSFAMYQTDRGYYKIFSIFEFDQYVYYWLKRAMTKELSASTVKDLVTQIKWSIHRRVENEMSDYIALQDQLLNLKTFECEPFHYNKNVFYFVDVPSEAMDKPQPAPRFQQFLNEVLVTPELETDEDMKLVLQEMFGYYLLNTTEAHQMFFLVGEGRNGKSVVLNILEEMIGLNFVSHKTIESLTTKEFAVADLIGKKLNICNEDESKFVKSDRFKALVAGDFVEARRLYQQGFSMKPYTKYAFSTNEPPTFSGYTVALLDRINIISFNRYFKPEERDTQLTKKLYDERAGIFFWAIQGAKRLIKNRFCFTRCKQMEKAKREFEKSISSAIMFFDDNYEESENSVISDEELYAEYVNWCEVRKNKPLKHENFFKDIRKNRLTLKSISTWSTTKNKTVTGRQLKPRID